MKIYIPFNSNDFNNIFSTLSISPRGFYPIRKYSFKRAHECLFNPFEFSLLAYSNPIFSQKDFDKDNGYIVNIEVDIPEQRLIKVNTKSVSVYEIKETIYLFYGFKLIFRKESELSETFARSLKSIETKFHQIAKKNSVLVTHYSDVTWAQSGYKLKLKDFLSDSISFEWERKVNKVLGATLGYAVGLQSSVGGEFGKLKALKRELENLTSVLSNNIGLKTNNGERERIIICLNEIYKFYEQIEPLNETLTLNFEGLSSSEVSKIGLSNLYGINSLDLIKEGLISLNPNNLPIQLIIEQTKRNIEAPYNNRYPDTYIGRIDENVNYIRKEINNLINERQLHQDLTKEKLLVISNNDPLVFSTESLNNSVEKLYLEAVIDFFTNQDKITSTEVFFSERGAILSLLGNHLKQTVPQFENSNEKQFLLMLFESFKNLRASFNPSSTQYETFKSLGVLFTSGRDLLKYFDNVSSAGVEFLNIPVSIWGAVYGLSSLPKTFTEDILNQPGKSDLIIPVLRVNLEASIKGELKSDVITDGISVRAGSEMDYNVGQINKDKEENAIRENLFELKVLKRKRTLEFQADSFERLLKLDTDLYNEELVLAVKQSLLEISDIFRLDDLKVSDGALLKKFEQSLKSRSKKIELLTNKGNVKKILSFYKELLKQSKLDES